MTTWMPIRLQRLFLHYNKEYWNGRLPGFSVLIDNSIDAFGDVLFRSKQIRVNVKLHKSDASIRATVLHEMAHLAVGKEGHGSAFFSQIEKLLSQGALLTKGGYMILCTKHKLPQSGGFSDVFVVDGRVFKTFISHLNHRCDSRERGPIESELRRIVFESELKAWEIASKDIDLLLFVPKFFGRVKIDKVVDECGVDISDQYLLDCCYSLEKLTGKELKFDDISCRFPSIVPLMQKAGIKYTLDMSAFLSDDGSSVKVFDFATSAAYADTEQKWISEGRP